MTERKRAQGLAGREACRFPAKERMDVEREGEREVTIDGKKERAESEQSFLQNVCVEVFSRCWVPVKKCGDRLSCKYPTPLP